MLNSKDMESGISFERAVEQLQQTVKRLESGELSLEEALKAFEEGVKLTRICQEQLKSAEQKIEILTKPSSNESTTGEAVELKPFSGPRS